MDSGGFRVLRVKMYSLSFISGIFFYFGTTASQHLIYWHK